jgi:hypothetical protein
MFILEEPEALDISGVKTDEHRTLIRPMVAAVEDRDFWWERLFL